MNFFTGFWIGAFFFFFVARYADQICKQAAKEANYDCSKCTAHCAGYTCYCHRQEPKE